MLSEAPLRRLCVFFPGALGDFICFLPALEFLSQQAQVELFTQTEFASLAPLRVRVRSLECFELRELFVSESNEEERLIRFYSSYDFVHSWTGSSQPDFVRRLVRVSKGRARVYPFRPEGTPMHQADYYCFCLRAGNRRRSIPKVVPRPDAVVWSTRYWARFALEGKPVLVLGPGSGAKEKNWPPAFYRAVALWWRQVTRGVVVVLLGPAEEERGGMQSLLEGVLVARNLNLARVAALLARSQVYLGNDSGITHLAAAVGVRTVALFGPSDWTQWSPRGTKTKIVRRTTECSPCERPLMRQCPHRMCLTRLDPSDVIEKLEKLPEVSSLTRGRAEIRV